MQLAKRVFQRLCRIDTVSQILQETTEHVLTGRFKIIERFLDSIIQFLLLFEFGRHRCVTCCKLLDRRDLFRLQLQPVLRRPPEPCQSHGAALIEGLKYLIRTPKLRYPMFQLLLTICLIFPQIVVIFRTYVREKFQLSSGEFGYVFSLPAMGALAGTLVFALWKPKTPIHTLRLSIPCLLVGYTLVPLMPTVTATAGTMMITGFFSYLTFASLTITMHLEVEEDFRGRIGSVIGLGFLAIGPMMSFPVGGLADRIGFTPAVWSLTWAFGLLSALFAYLHFRALGRRAQYKEKT